MTLQAELNRLAGTTGLAETAAANAWAGTTGLSLVGALNAKAGTTGRDLQGVMNALAGTTGLGVVGAARSAVAFGATTVANLAFWLDASTISASDGASLSQWNDVSGNTRHATQATGTAQPTYRAAPTGYNGKPAVQFDGSDWLAANAVAPLLAGANLPVTVITVGQIDATGGAYCGFGYSVNTNAQLAVSRATTNYSAFRRNQDNANGTAVTAAIGTQPSVLTYASGSTHEIFLNGTSTATSSTLIGSLNVDRFTVGGLTRVTTGQILTGYIAEILVYTQILTASERQTVQSYLGSKYGITVAS